MEIPDGKLERVIGRIAIFMHDRVGYAVNLNRALDPDFHEKAGTTRESIEKLIRQELGAD